MDFPIAELIHALRRPTTTPAKKARGYGSWDNDRPPIYGVIGR